MAHVLSGRLALTKGRTPADVDAALASFERVPRLFPGTEGVAAAGYYAGETLRTVRRIDEALDRYRRVRDGISAIDMGRAGQPRRGLLPRAAGQRAHARCRRFSGCGSSSPTRRSPRRAHLNTIIYRLYVRAAAQPPYAFSGKSIGNERADYKDVMGISVGSRRPAAARPQGRRRDLRRQGRRRRNGRGPGCRRAFFVDEKNRIVIARNGAARRRQRRDGQR